MPKTFLFLPSANETIRAWAAHLDGAVPELHVVIAESIEQAQHEIENAAAFGTLLPELLANAGRLRWLHAPAAAPPAGYYYSQLVRHVKQLQEGIEAG